MIRVKVQRSRTPILNFCPIKMFVDVNKCLNEIKWPFLFYTFKIFNFLTKNYIKSAYNMETNVEENRKILKDSEHAAQMCQVEEVANANIVSRLFSRIKVV